VSAFTRSRAKFNCRCDYWENKKNYKRVQKLSQSSQDMITNIRRECKRSGIVEFCSSCSKWYHSDCHSFGRCDQTLKCKQVKSVLSYCFNLLFFAVFSERFAA